MGLAWATAAAVTVSAALAGFMPAALYEDLFTYPDVELRALFRDIVAGTGETCSEVTTTVFLGADARASGYFLFSCREGGRYLLQISDDGTGKVVECTYASELGMDCDHPAGLTRPDQGG